MKKHHYEEAREVLEILASETKNPNVYWSLSLIETQLGNLHEAMACLEKVDIENFTEAQAFVEELREKLPKYDSLCHDYHYAMTLLHQNKEKEAFQILEEIMVWKQKIPLPVPMYRDYLLLLSHKIKIYV